MNRRYFIKLLAATSALSTFPKAVWANLGTVVKQETKDIYELVAQSMRFTMGEDGRTYNIMTYNDTVVSPILWLKKGKPVTVHVTNDLPDNLSTTVHWHGLRVPLNMDGVPYISQPPIANGHRFTYTFTPKESGTFWYHSHVSMGQQTQRGLSGALIVQEDNPPIVDQDIVWHVRDFVHDSLRGMMDDMFQSHQGQTGDAMLVNDIDITRSKNTITMGKNERIRLRIINACGARTLHLHSTQLSGQIIALDGHAIPVKSWQSVNDKTAIALGAGQRMDIIIDGGNKQQTIPIYNDDFVIGQVDIRGQKRQTPLTESIQLPLPTRYADIESAMPLTLDIDGGAMFDSISHYFKTKENLLKRIQETNKFWFFNGTTLSSDDLRTGNYNPLFTLKYGHSYVVTVNNHTSWEHPLHVHSLLMQIIERNGHPVNDKYLSDTILIAPGETLKFALLADVMGSWMFHCHIDDHMMSGMSSMIDVVA